MRTLELQQILSIALKSGNSNNLDLDSYHANSRDVTKNKNVQEKEMLTDTHNLINQFSVHRKRVISRKLDFKCSWWLSVFPTAGTHFELSPDEFRDSLAMRYGKTPTRLQSTCDADGEVFDVNHALNCPRGGLVYGRHNEMRDIMK